MKKTIVDLFEASVKRYPNNTFLLEKTKKELSLQLMLKLKNRFTV